MSTTSTSPTSRGQGGYTLVEAVVTLLIVVMVTMCVATGVAFAQRQFDLSMAMSESKVLCSTLENAIRNEIRYANIVDARGGAVRFTSLNYADTSGEDPTWELGVERNGIVVPGGYGEVVLHRTGADGEIVSELLPSTAYTRGMTAAVGTGVTADAEGRKAVEVTLSVYNGKGEELLSEEFSVLPENTDVMTDD